MKGDAFCEQSVQVTVLTFRDDIGVVKNILTNMVKDNNCFSDYRCAAKTA
jgi:hypothetical protein